MTINRKLSGLSLALLAIFVMVGCDACSKNGLVQIPHTVDEKIASSNNILAATNLAVAKGVIALQSSDVITMGQAAPIATASLHIAEASKAIAEIMQQPGDWNGKQPQIKTILDSLGTIVPNLPSSEATAGVLASIDALNLMLAEFKKEVSK